MKSERDVLATTPVASRFGRLSCRIDEEIPGDGELDLTTALRLWHEAHPDGYMLLEHLPEEQYPRAAENTHRIIKEAHIPLH